jgi:hypothetical protein
LIAIIAIIAHILYKAYEKTREDDAHNKHCPLRKGKLLAFKVFMLNTEGLMVLCVVLEIIFRVRRSLWEAKGRYLTAKEWGRETLAVLLPFYLGAFMAIATVAWFAWVAFVDRHSECMC